MHHLSVYQTHGVTIFFPIEVFREGDVDDRKHNHDPTDNVKMGA